VRAANAQVSSEEAGYQQSLAQATAKSGTASLDLALAEADVAIRLVGRMGRLEEEQKWGASAEKLLAHAGANPGAPLRRE
jgi:hypothetical protein